MQIRVLAFWLLLGRIGSVFFILMVIMRQIRLFRLSVQRDIVVFRRVLFGLAVVILAGNAIPLMVDVVTIIGFVERSASHVNPVGLVYAISNDLTSLFSAILIWLLYRMAARTVLITERDKRVALKKADNR